MTENERFELIIKGLKKGTRSGIWDNQKQHNMGIGDELWLGEVVAMLNEGVTLAEENKKLKKQLLLANDLIDGYIALADKYRKPIKSLALGDDLGYWNGVYQYMKKLRERIGVL